MTFFVDNNLAPQLAAGLKGFGEDVVHLQDVFPDGTPDERWLPYVGENSLTLVTRDDAIRRRPAEIAALRTHKVGAFFLGGKQLSRCQLIQQVVRNWPRMKELSKSTARPFAFRVPPSGTKIARIPLQ